MDRDEVLMDRLFWILGGWKVQGTILTDDPEQSEPKLRASVKESPSRGEDSPAQCSSPETRVMESGSKKRNISQGFWLNNLLLFSKRSGVWASHL